VVPYLANGKSAIKALCTPDKVNEAKEAGADYAGLDEFIQKIQEGWTDIDVIVATPQVMAQVGKVGRILGPRGLMPNPKTGTVTQDIAGAIREVKGGKIAFRIDKYGIIHSPVGRVSFSHEQLAQNAEEL
jgi:large subunit ribosomal protein L1